MNELDNINATFGNSEPVFKITTNKRGDSLSFSTKNQYVPQKTEDPVQALLASNWRESLNVPARRFISCTNTDSIYCSMFEVVLNCAINYSPLKNPKQSRLYKWLNEQPLSYTNAVAVGIIALYRYIKNNELDKYFQDSTNPHAKNVLTVLELMREKHEGK